MASVIVDTDVVSFRFKKDSRARLYGRHLTGRTPCISFMSLAELHGWALQHRWGQFRRDELSRHLGRYAVLHSNQLMCEWWAEVTTQSRRQGRRLDVADAWIAATALSFNIPLVTHNPGDYAGIRGLTVISESKA